MGRPPAIEAFSPAPAMRLTLSIDDMYAVLDEMRASSQEQLAVPDSLRSPLYRPTGVPRHIVRSAPDHEPAAARPTRGASSGAPTRLSSPVTPSPTPAHSPAAGTWNLELLMPKLCLSPAPAPKVDARAGVDVSERALRLHGGGGHTPAPRKPRRGWSVGRGPSMDAGVVDCLDAEGGHTTVRREQIM
jgi:hypothetical protein